MNSEEQKSIKNSFQGLHQSQALKELVRVETIILEIKSTLTFLLFGLFKLMGRIFVNIPENHDV
jgi:hypothetical protein